MNKKKYYFIIILSSLLVITMAYYLNDITPFGNESLLTIDLYHQYGPMLGELYSRIINGSNMIYSFNMGLGLPIFRNFFNYLSSPLNILIFFFKYTHLLTSYSIVIGLKTIVSAVTCGYYFEKKFGIDSKLIFLTVLYAFNAYFVAYYWNIMWTDGIYMLPLIILGIEKLIDDDYPYLYVCSLFLMILINYYIGYMLCIFSVIYYTLYIIISTSKYNLKTLLKKSLLFAGYSLLAVGLCAFFLIPMYTALIETSAVGDNLPNIQYYTFTLKEFLYNHLSGVGSTVLREGIICAPNISCGIVTLSLLLLFVGNKHISLKIRICYVTILIILIFSFMYAPLDYIWHGMHVPNDLPYRYSFIYCFILIIISAYEIENIKNINKTYLIAVYIVMIILISSMFLLKYQNINDIMIIENYVILTIFFVGILIYLHKSANYKYVFTIILGMAIAECILYINNNWILNTPIDDYYNDVNRVSEAINLIKRQDLENFYRIENESHVTLNDSSFINYYGDTTFSSMMYKNVAMLNYGLGLPGNKINSYIYRSNTPIYNLLFDIKYIIDYQSDEKSDIYYQNIGNNSYRSIYTKGLMFAVDDDILNWNYNNKNPFNNQNYFMEKATGVGNILEKYSNIEEEKIYDKNGNIIVKYTTGVTQDDLYLYVNNKNVDFIVIGNQLYEINATDYQNDVFDYLEYNDYSETYIINDKLSEFYIGYNNYGVNFFKLYKINYDNFIRAFDSLTMVDITKFNENIIEGTINLDADKIIYTSIPYDDGWFVYVDDVKVDSLKIGGSLLGFYVTGGDHSIKLNYRIPYLNLGLTISGFAVMILFYVIKRHYK